MPEIDDWGGLFSDEMREVWPILGRVTQGLGGCLMGGTALAIHLRHRVSHDLDYMASMGFSGDRLAKKFEKAVGEVELYASGSDQMHARVKGVQVQVFKTPHRGANPGHVKTLQKPIVIDGLPVASLPDLLASKMDVIMYRPKLRDFIDLVAVDISGPYTLEDGLRFHMHRYGITPASNDAARIVRLLEDPGELDNDPFFGDREGEVLQYLASRAPDLEQRLNQMRLAQQSPNRPEPPDRKGRAGLTASFDEAITGPLAPAPRCGYIGPKSGKRCKLPRGHKGKQHRYE